MDEQCYRTTKEYSLCHTEYLIKQIFFFLPPSRFATLSFFFLRALLSITEEQNHCGEDNHKCREHFNFKYLCDESCRKIILRWIFEEVMKVAKELNNHLC
jgi:hypothetical protein